MNRRNFLQSVATALPSQAAANKPNIVLILVDDFGFGSLNCNGADPKLIRTPNLDRIAREGVRFTDANSPSSVCSPSRYALMTGRYCWRTSLQCEVLSTTAPLHIEPTRLTIASLLKAEGYNTAAIGKWHLGIRHRRDRLHSRTQTRAARDRLRLPLRRAAESRRRLGSVRREPPRPGTSVKGSKAIRPVALRP